MCPTRPASPDSPLSRATYVLLALGTIALGLLVRFAGGGVLSPDAHDFTGDLLWGAMIFWWTSALLPAARPGARALLALALCAAVEISQLYHPAWLDALRTSSLGRLVLGSDYDARDLLAYLAGVLLCTVADDALRQRRGAD